MVDAGIGLDFEQRGHFSVGFNQLEAGDDGLGVRGFVFRALIAVFDKPLHAGADGTTVSAGDKCAFALLADQKTAVNKILESSSNRPLADVKKSGKLNFAWQCKACGPFAGGDAVENFFSDLVGQRLSGTGKRIVDHECESGEDFLIIGWTGAVQKRRKGSRYVKKKRMDWFGPCVRAMLRRLRRV